MVSLSYDLSQQNHGAEGVAQWRETLHNIQEVLSSILNTTEQDLAANTSTTGQKLKAILRHSSKLPGLQKSIPQKQKSTEVSNSRRNRESVYIHSEHPSATRKNKTMSLAGKWTLLEII